MLKLSAREITDFNGYLRACTDRQVLGVLEKERQAGRNAYVALAENEALRRNLEKE